MIVKDINPIKAVCNDDDAVDDIVGQLIRTLHMLHTLRDAVGVLIERIDPVLIQTQISRLEPKISTISSPSRTPSGICQRVMEIRSCTDSILSMVRDAEYRVDLPNVSCRDQN